MEIRRETGAFYACFICETVYSAVLGPDTGHKPGENVPAAALCQSGSAGSVLIHGHSVSYEGSRPLKDHHLAGFKSQSYREIAPLHILRVDRPGQKSAHFSVMRRKHAGNFPRKSLARDTGNRRGVQGIGINYSRGPELEKYLSYEFSNTFIHGKSGAD